MKVDIAQIIKTLKASKNDPAAAIKKVEQEADDREREAAALRGLAKTIRLLPDVDLPEPEPATPEPAPASPPDNGRDAVPQGIDAVRRVMREGGVWNAKDMLAELTRRGWEPKGAKHPVPTVEAAMNRLFRVKGEIERVGRGEYTYKGFPGTPTLETLSGGAEP
jgi:hypothetical protein